MYLANRSADPARAGSSWRRFAGGNVVALGMVSLLTDVSSEMVTAVLPAYLVLGLHLSLVQYGVIDGIYTGATAFTRLLGGVLADRFRQRKLVAFLGYALSAVAKLGLLLAPANAGAIGAVIAVDRTGKGVRTAPRDALIAGSVKDAELGAAFGVHRTMDTIGAFLGPLAALGLLLLAGLGAYDVVFVGSLAFALLGLLVLALFVRNPAGSARASPAEPPRLILPTTHPGSILPTTHPGSIPPTTHPGSILPTTHPGLRDFAGLLRRTSLRRLLVVAGVLGLATIGDGFVYLTLQRRDDLPVTAFPLLAMGTSLAFLLLAIPLGRLADRIGRWPVVAAGYGCLVAVYLLLAVGHAPIVVILLLYGVFYAATDGVLPALAAPLIPAELKTTGLALLQTGQAVAYLCSSVLFGFAGQHLGLAPAFLGAAALGVLALPVSALLLRPVRHRVAGA